MLSCPKCNRGDLLFSGLFCSECGSGLVDGSGKPADPIALERTLRGHRFGAGGWLLASALFASQLVARWNDGPSWIAELTFTSSAFAVVGVLHLKAARCAARVLRGLRRTKNGS